MANWIEEQKVEETTPTQQVPETPVEQPTEQPVQTDQEWVPTTGLTPLQVEQPIVPEITATEPSPIEPVIAPEVTVEPTKVEETKVVEPKVVEPVIKASKEPTGKVETAQDIKAKETSNQASEDALNEQNKITKTDEFNKMIQSGATLEELSSFGSENPNIRKDLAVILRDNLKNTANVKYFGKYSTMTNEQLQAEVNSGNIVPWSEQFNLLPENQRNSFKQYQNVNESVDINNKTDFSSWDKALSVENLVQGMQGLFSVDMRQSYKDMLNSPEFLEINSKLSDKRAEISKFDIEMEDQSENIIKEMAWNLPWVINAAVRDANRDSVKEKRLLLAEYSALQWEHANLKSNAELELDFLKYEDQQNKQTYMTALGLYETRRKEWLDIAAAEAKAEWDIAKEERIRDFQREQREFLKENNIIATQNAFDNQKELAEFRNDLSKSNVKWDWEQRFDWLYFLTDTWEARKVVNWGYEKQDDWTSTYTYVDQDGKPIVETYDITWQVIWASTWDSNFSQAQIDLLNTPNGTIIPTRLKQTTNKNWGKECAEYINDIFASNVWARMWDSYSSKLAVANQKTGWLWSIVAWQPNPSNKEFAKFWHAGVIVWESDDGNSWHVKSSNLNVDGKISVVEVPKNVIGWYRSTNLFEKPKVTEFDDAQKNFLETVDTSKGFNKEAKATIANLGLTEKDVFAFKASNLPKEKTRQFNDILSKINNLKWDNGKFSSARWFSWAVWFGFWEALLPWTRSWDFASDFESFKSLLTVENLDKMSGVLTDKDIDILKSAALSIELWNSETQFVKRMEEVENVYRKALWEEVIDKSNLFYTDKTWIKYTKESLKKEILNQIDNKETTPEEVKVWMKQNNIKF